MPSWSLDFCRCNSSIFCFNSCGFSVLTTPASFFIGVFSGVPCVGVGVPVTVATFSVLIGVPPATEESGLSSQPSSVAWSLGVSALDSDLIFAVPFSFSPEASVPVLEVLLLCTSVAVSPDVSAFPSSLSSATCFSFFQLLFGSLVGKF